MTKISDQNELTQSNAITHICIDINKDDGYDEDEEEDRDLDSVIGGGGGAWVGVGSSGCVGSGCGGDGSVGTLHISRPVCPINFSYEVEVSVCCIIIVVGLWV